MQAIESFIRERQLRRVNVGNIQFGRRAVRGLVGLERVNMALDAPDGQSSFPVELPVVYMRFTVQPQSITPGLS